MTYLTLLRPSPRRRRQIGATAVEAAIVLAAILFPVVAVVNALEDNASDQISEDGNRVGTPTEVSNQIVTTTTTSTTIKVTGPKPKTK